MLLTIDVGNTQTVIGVYDADVLLCMWRLATDKSDTSDELRLKFQPLILADGIALENIDGSALASVVPSLTLAWRAALLRAFGKEPVVCTAQAAAPLFKSNYGNPSEIGADRVADAVAALSIYGAPVIVADFGTATNIEVIDRDGYFVGGIIAPGLETSAAALFAHASKLAATDLVDPHTAIGHNTTEAIQSGIVYGEVDRVDGLVRRVFEQLGYETTVVATGGLANRVAALSKTIAYVNPQLTLEGLRLIYETHAAVDSDAGKM